MERSGRVLIYQDGTTVSARLLGAVNVETVRLFEEQLRRSLRSHCRSLSLDLGAADYVDSDGIRWLQRLQCELVDRGVDLSLAVREGSQAERTLRLLQLDRVFRIEAYPSENTGEPAAYPQGSA